MAKTMDKIKIRVFIVTVRGGGLEYAVNTRFIGSSRMVQPAVLPPPQFSGEHIGPGAGTMMAHFKTYEAAQRWIEQFNGLEATLQEVCDGI